MNRTSYIILTAMIGTVAACVPDREPDTAMAAPARQSTAEAPSGRPADDAVLAAAASMIVGLRPRGAEAALDSVLWKLCDQSAGSDVSTWALCSPRQVAARMPDAVAAALAEAHEAQCRAQPDACRGPAYRLDLAEPRVAGDSAFVAGSWRRVAAPLDPAHGLGFGLVLARHHGAWSYVRTAYLWES